MKNCLNFSISLTIVMLFSAQADAHCYSVWHYKKPQRCYAENTSKHIRPTTPELKRHYIIHFQPPETKVETSEQHVEDIPVDTEEMERAIGIKKLKELMK